MSVSFHYASSYNVGAFFAKFISALATQSFKFENVRCHKVCSSVIMTFFTNFRKWIETFLRRFHGDHDEGFRIVPRHLSTML